MKRYVVIQNGYFDKIFNVWDECKAYTHKKKGIKFKGFLTTEELVEFLINNVKYDLDKTFEELDLPHDIIESKMIELCSIDTNDKTNESNTTNSSTQKANHILGKLGKDLNEIELISYVDGSYNIYNGDYGYGLCMIKDNKVVFKACGVGNDEEAKSMRQVMGELDGALKSVEYAIKYGYKEICICYDYLGIEKWATNEWKANKTHTQKYKELIRDRYANLIDIYFYKVKAHSGVEFNEVADELAKQGANLNMFSKYVVVLDNEFETIVNTENELKQLLSENSNYKYKLCRTSKDAYDYLFENTNDKDSIIDLLGMYGITYINN